MGASGLPLCALLSGVLFISSSWAANRDLPSSCPVAAGRTGKQGEGGWSQSFPQPASSAIRLELQGQTFFQKRQYDESIRLFNEALAADPSYLLPRIGLACVAVRKDQLGRAAQEITGLLNQAFVPWHRVAVGDIDLAALWAHGEQTALAKNIKAAAEAWGKRVASGVMLLSRVAAPVQLAAEDGPLLFRPAQEIVSWDPATGRYYQVTSEAGRVFAFVRSEDGRFVLYVTAQKIRREAGKLTSFESVGVHLLRLADMHLVSRRLLGGDFRFAKLALRFQKGKAQVSALSSTDQESAFAIDEELRPLQRGSFSVNQGLLVSTSKVGESSPGDFGRTKSCRFRLAPAFVKGIPTVQVIPPKGPHFYLASRFGLGLNGLPFPEGPSQKAKL